ncbi:MAG: glycosyltransferase [Chloroflexi bacterium]|nr:glycosyltransferase [Chloroflexota bacterium]
MGLTVCMITKNEEPNIGRALESVKPVANQIVVVDTGSTDRTVDIAKDLGAEVHEHPWNGDFSAARNASLRYAKHSWILVLDGDEELDPSSIPAVQAIERRREPKPLGYRVISASFTETGVQEGEVLRLFRNRKGLLYVGRIHEQVAPWVFRSEEDMPQSGIRLIHKGYTDAEIARKNKRERNRSLLEAAIAQSGDPSAYLTYQLAKEWALIGKFDKAAKLLESIMHRTDRSNHPAFVRTLASCYERLGRDEEEVKLLDRWIPVYADYTDLIYLRAAAKARSGRLLEAAADLAMAVAKGDSPPRYEHTVGTGSFLALEMLARVNEAFGCVNEAERLRRLARAKRSEQIPV